jgi:signal transduction histidine kinase
VKLCLRSEEFASIVSHDLRNPLQVANGRLELVREECESDHLEGVAYAPDRIGVLIEDLLTLAREGEGR